jgi:hypothetical protein
MRTSGARRERVCERAEEAMLTEVLQFTAIGIQGTTSLVARRLDASPRLDARTCPACCARLTCAPTLCAPHASKSAPHATVAPPRPPPCMQLLRRPHASVRPCPPRMPRTWVPLRPQDYLRMRPLTTSANIAA